MESKGRLHSILRDIKTGKAVVSFMLDTVSDEALENIREKDLRIKAVRWTNKRSLDSNAYFHVLVNKIAEKTSQSRFRVKNTLIARYGQPEMIEDDEMIYKSNAPEEYMLEQEFIHAYPCRFVEENGKTITFYRIFRGSHTYNSVEMSHLIEGTVAEAKDLGIETMTPKELERMNSEWQSQNQ